MSLYIYNKGVTDEDTIRLALTAGEDREVTDEEVQRAVAAVTKMRTDPFFGKAIASRIVNGLYKLRWDEEDEELKYDFYTADDAMASMNRKGTQ